MSDFDAVGYQVRFDRKTHSSKNRITFLTEGLLLRKLAGDQKLSEYSVIIIDEVHERHIDCDILLGCLLKVAEQRPNLRVVLMSATIQLDLYKKFLERYTDKSPPVIEVPGRLFPIDLEYLPPKDLRQGSEYEVAKKSGNVTLYRDKNRDNPDGENTKGEGQKEKFNTSPYVDLLQLIDKRHKNQKGDLLIFLPGINEIEHCCEALKIYAQESGKWIICALHSTLTIEEQDKCFRYPPEGVRKCIVATNIAETSVTFDGIRYVADSGKEKQIYYDEMTRIESLREQNISMASAKQRMGRAGRTGPGICFRMYSQKDYDLFSEYQTPEIHRTSLDSTLLQIIALNDNLQIYGNRAWLNFGWLEQPNEEARDLAIDSLKFNGCLSETDLLTKIGIILSKLPVDITVGKMLLFGKILNVAEHAMMICAAISVQNPFSRKSFMDSYCYDRWKDELLSENGDPFTLNNAFNTWLEMKNERANTKYWCQKRALEERRFYEMANTKSQFENILELVMQQASQMDRENNRKKGVEYDMFGQAILSEKDLERKRIVKEIRNLKKQAEENARQKKKLEFTSGDDLQLPDECSAQVQLSIEEKIMHLEFLLKHSEEEFYNPQEKTMQMLSIKTVLAIAMYPNIAIGDPMNNYAGKSYDKCFFHIEKKDFLLMHPNSCYGMDPSILEIKDMARDSFLKEQKRQKRLFERQQMLEIEKEENRKRGDLPEQFSSSKTKNREENSTFAKIEKEKEQKKAVFKMKKFLGKPHKYGKLSSDHNLIVFTSILETTKPYLMNPIKVSALQTLVLCSRFVDVSRDYTRYIFDNWIEVQIESYTNVFDLRSFLQNAIICRLSFEKQTERLIIQNANLSSSKDPNHRNIKTSFIDKLARFLNLKEIRYYIGRLGPVERKSLVDREKAIDLDSTVINLEFVEHTGGWLKIGSVESLFEEGTFDLRDGVEVDSGDEVLINDVHQKSNLINIPSVSEDRPVDNDLQGCVEKPQSENEHEHETKEPSIFNKSIESEKPKFSSFRESRRDFIDKKRASSGNSKTSDEVAPQRGQDKKRRKMAKNTTLSFADESEEEITLDDDDLPRIVKKKSVRPKIVDDPIDLTNADDAYERESESENLKNKKKLSKDIDSTKIYLAPEMTGKGGLFSLSDYSKKTGLENPSDKNLKKKSSSGLSALEKARLEMKKQMEEENMSIEQKRKRLGNEFIVID